MSNPTLPIFLACLCIPAGCATGPIAENIAVPRDALERSGEPAPADGAPTALASAARQATADSQRNGPWEFTFGAGGTNDEHFDVGNGQLNASVGYYFNECVEVVARQGASYTDDEGGAAGVDDGDVWDFQTRLALDLHLPLGVFVPYIGANIGYLYGDTEVTHDTLCAGPEVGIKIYLQRDAFLHVGAEYEFFFETQESLRDVFEVGQVFYSAGLGLRF